MIWGTFLCGQSSVTGWQVGLRRSVEFDDGSVVAWIHLLEILIPIIDECGAVESCADDGGVVFIACGLDSLFWGEGVVICTFFFISVIVVIGIIFFFFRILSEIFQILLDKISFFWDSRRI